MSDDSDRLLKELLSSVDDLRRERRSASADRMMHDDRIVIAEARMLNAARLARALLDRE